MKIVACEYISIMFTIGAVCAALLSPFAAAFMTELEDSGRVWFPGLWAYIGVAGYVLFCVLTMCTTIWETLVK